MNDCFDRINKATELYTITKNEDESFYGLLVPPKDGSIYAYNRPALSIDGTISEIDGTIQIVIRSIDDSGLTMWFREGNKKVLNDFLEFLKDESPYTCPTIDQVLEFAKSHDGSLSYW